MKGIERRNLEKGQPRSPTGEEWRAIEEKIAAGNFSGESERKNARTTVRYISRADRRSAKVIFDRLSEEGKTELQRILDEVGFKLDFQDKNER